MAFIIPKQPLRLLNPISELFTVYRGILDLPEEERICTCGKRMHINSHPDIYIRHLSIGGNLSGYFFRITSSVVLNAGPQRASLFRLRLKGISLRMRYFSIPVICLPGNYTNKEMAEITGLGKNTVKEIDKKRLQSIYTTDNGREAYKPEKQAKYLGIDEFKLHNGRRYATHIIDLETGHVLWIQKGKSKQVVYDFIDHVGMDG